MAYSALKSSKQLNYFSICVQITFFFLKKSKIDFCLVESSCFRWNCLFIVHADQCCVQVLHLCSSFSPSLPPPPSQLSHILVTLVLLHVASSLPTHICRYWSRHPSHCLVECSSSKVESNLASVLMSIAAIMKKDSKCPLLYFLPTWYCELYHLQNIYFYHGVPTESLTQICVKGASCTAAWNTSFNTLGQFLDHM